jgi:DNA-binding transcriptional MerR regulator/quercetin dioxygenase-like cupin family protein
MRPAHREPYLKIGEVAKQVGVSPSVIRSWESMGLARPRRSASKYRLYSQEDVRLLKRARFLRRARGLNAAAIVQLLKREGRVRAVAADGNAGAIGAHLRKLRARRRLSLAEVAHEVGISVGFLSALERSRMSGSVGTLRKLARFYKTNILEFFDAHGGASRQVRPTERKVLEGDGVRMELLAWGNTVMEPHLFRVAPEAGSGDSYAHEGEEFIYVLRGQLEIALSAEKYRLRSGDSFYFESATPHRWRNPGRAETWVLWVNTPPTF